jgi:hypothetical protein
VSQAVRDLLAAEHIYCLRVNSGNILITGDTGKKRMVKLAPKGTADLLAPVPAKDGLFMPLWIETKVGKNGLSAEQKSFRDDMIYRGYSYIVARGSQDVLDWLIEFRNKRQ